MLARPMHHRKNWRVCGDQIIEKMHLEIRNAIRKSLTYVKKVTIVFLAKRSDRQRFFHLAFIAKKTLSRLEGLIYKDGNICMLLLFYSHSTITNLDFMEGSWKNSQDSAGPRLIKLPTSVGDRAKSCTINVPSIKPNAVQSFRLCIPMLA